MPNDDAALLKEQLLAQVQRIHAGKLRVPPGEQLSYLQRELGKIPDPVLRDACETIFLSTQESAMPKKINTDIQTRAATPLDILREAIQAVPAVKYALGIAGVVSVIAIVSGFKVNLRVAVLGAVVMFILMTVLVLFARLSTASNRSFALAGVVMLWFSLLATMAVATLMITSVFFQRPLDLRQWLVGSSSLRQALPPPAGPEMNQEKPKPAEKQTQRVLVGKDFGLQVDGCQSRGQRFSATAPGELDLTKGSPRGFDLEVTGNNGHGVRNISVGGNTISFEAYADGPGTQQPIAGCVGAQGANVNVNVFAYLRE